MAVKEDVLRGVRHLRRLVVIVDQHFLRCFICRGHTRSQHGTIDHDANDLVRLVAKGMCEFAEFVGVVNRKAPEENCSMLGELRRENALLRLQILKGFDYRIEVSVRAIASRWLQCQRCDSVACVRRSKEPLIRW